MYKHLLIATDGSDLANNAARQGLDLAKALGAKATIVTVTEPFGASIPVEVAIVFSEEDYQKGMTSHADKVLKDASDTASQYGVAHEVVHVKNQFPAEGIIDIAKTRDCDLIVMASHGWKGLKRILLGSQANRVVTQSTISVLICR